MKNLRNLIMLGLLVVFFASYGAVWAYQSLYKKPRSEFSAEIDKYRKMAESYKNGADSAQKTFDTTWSYYTISLPRSADASRTQYRYWLIELMKFCEIEGADITSENPSRLTGANRFNWGVDYRFIVRGEASLEQLTRMLFEFYSAALLHRISAMTIAPIEGKEGEVRFAMTIDAVAIPAPHPQYPYPGADLPKGDPYYRMLSRDFSVYQVISDRNVLQASRGGVDRADYARLTAINQVDGETEVWISVRTDGTVVKTRKGEQVRIGSFIATLLDVIDEDVVFDRGGMRWLVTLGDDLNKAFALPPEVFVAP